MIFELILGLFITIFMIAFAVWAIMIVWVWEKWKVLTT